MKQKGKINEVNSDKQEELCCADQTVCSLDCAPKENSKSKCGCGGGCC